MQKIRKKNIAIMAICLSIILFVNGCTKEEKLEITTNNENSIVYANFRDLRDLNPHLYNGEMFAQNLLFEGLIKINDDGSFEPWLAESWEIKDEGKTYVFKLREDVYFSDGEKFNAEAAAANFNAILDNGDRHTWLESIKLMMEVDKSGGKSVEATGEYELTLRLADSYYPFMVELGVTRPFRFISPKSFIDGTTKSGVDGYIGTSSYILDEYVVDEYSIFKVNENYWGEKPDIEEVIVKVIPDSQTRVMALENGEIDLVYGANLIDTATYLKFRDLEGFETQLSDPITSRMMLVNTTNEILKDVRVRQAIQHATDRRTIADGIFEGIESPAETLFAKSIPYADLDLEPYEYNLEKAKELLDEAGWKVVQGEKYRYKDGKQLDLTLYYCVDEVTEKAISEFFQFELGKIGINLSIIGEEEQGYSDRMDDGEFDIIFHMAWGSPYDPQSFLGSMREPVHGDYVAQLGLTQKEQIDETITKALKTTNEEEREEYYRYVLTTLHEEAVYIPLTYKRNIAIHNSEISNVLFMPSQYDVPINQMIKE